MTAQGRFEHGEFLVEEAFFDSDAARLAANGRVDLLGADSRLTVLVGRSPRSTAGRARSRSSATCSAAR